MIINNMFQMYLEFLTAKKLRLGEDLNKHTPMGGFIWILYLR